MNLLLHTDVYKMGHMEQYNPDVEFIQFHMVVRSNIKYKDYVFFGLKYYIEKYLKCPTRSDVAEFIKLRNNILGSTSKDVEDKLNKLADLKYLPIKIYSKKEGTTVNIGEPVIVIENTVAGFHWLVGIIESLLLKVWNTCTVATLSKQYKELFEEYCDKTVGIKELIPFQVHDFGYRGCSSEETSMLSGMAHLLKHMKYKL